MKACMMTEGFNRIIKATKSFVQKTGSRKIYQYILIDGYTTYLIFAQQGIKRVAAYKIGVRLEEVQV